MAEQSITRTWENIKTKSVTDTSTGNVRVFVIGLPPAPITGATEIEVLRTTDGSNKWEYTLTGQNALLGYYNQNNTTQINTQELNQLVFTDAIKQYNNDRAAVLNNNDNYTNATEAEDNRRFFVQTSKIPGVIDPVTNQQVSSDGTTLIDPPPTAPPGPANPDSTQDPNANNNNSGNQGSVPIYGVSINSIKEVQMTSSNVLLRYPKKETNDNYDYLKIQVAKYVPGLSIDNIAGEIPSVTKRLTETGGTVVLPMYPGISESNSVDWGSDQLNPIQAGLGRVALNAIAEGGTGDIVGAIETTGSGILNFAKQVTDDENIQKFISAYFAGRAVQANILGRTTGMVVNPNLELLFRGPKLRSFRYSYRFTPRDRDEAVEVRKIIKFFKKEMAVQRKSNLFLGTPNIFLLNYIFKSSESADHPYLNKIKPCALTSFNVNYTPDGTYMTYNDPGGSGDGSMTSYTVDMQFDELEPIYADELGTDDSYLDDPTMGY